MRFHFFTVTRALRRAQRHSTGKRASNKTPIVDLNTVSRAERLNARQQRAQRITERTQARQHKQT